MTALTIACISLAVAIVNSIFTIRDIRREASRRRRESQGHGGHGAGRFIR